MIISVFITNSHSKPLLARQYTPTLSRAQLESLLTTFSSLHTPQGSGSGYQNNSSASQQTTHWKGTSTGAPGSSGSSSVSPKSSSHQSYIEVNEFRFVFVRCEEVYLGLISDKYSNIIEDLDTLQLLSRVEIPLLTSPASTIKQQLKDTIDKVTPDNVLDFSFEIMFAFDELISLGYKENLSLDQVRTILEMDSHDENLHNLIQQTRMDDAIKEGKKAAKEFAAKKREYKRKGLDPDSFRTGISSKDSAHLTSAGGNMSSGMGGFDSDASSSMSGAGSFDDYSSRRVGSLRSESENSQKSARETAPKKTFKPKTISIKKKGPAKSQLVQQLTETGELEKDEDAAEVDSDAEGPAEAMVPLNQKSVHVKVEEGVHAELSREGGLNSLEVKGEMFLTISDPEKTNIELILKEDRNSSFTCKTHPNIDKRRFNKENTIALKKNKSNFPTNLALKILTWRLQKEDEGVLPISVSCWPSESAKGMSVNVEYELIQEEMTLENVMIRIPLPTDAAAPEISNVEHGTYKYDRQNHCLVWSLETVDSEHPDGSIEFDVDGASNDGSFFPLQISFNSAQTLSGLEVDHVNLLGQDEEESVEFSQEIAVSAPDFVIS